MGLVAAAAPWEDGGKDRLLFQRVLAYTANKYPKQLAVVADAILRTIKWFLAKRIATKRVDELESFAQGSEGFVQEARLISGDWGFDFEDVGYDEIQLWHGTADTAAPIKPVRSLAMRLPHAKMCEYEGKGHGSILEHLDEIVAKLLPQERNGKLK